MTTALGKESSIAVTVRVRPFTSEETSHLRTESNGPVFLGDGSFAGSQNDGSSGSSRLTGAGKQLRKVINVVDDKMLIFDPPESNPLASMQKAAFPKTTNRIREHRFVFDRLFDESCTQKEVYNQTTKPLIDNILDGYNASVFAYGATGCGKTHTISGRPEDPGIIFLTMQELFERINTLQDTNNIDVSLSYLEIYNETIRDLLVPQGNSSNKLMVLREDSEKRISVSNLSSHRPNSVHEVMDMILQGNQNRTMSPTEANATSSRSHAVLQINVTQKPRTAELSEAHTFATLSIIDLAGSERAAATKNRGERLMEGANINKSLLALGNCINALCDPRRRGHVPYRDSKLTRLLKFSLGGNCKTVMIVCVSPSSAHYDETLNTLKYADRAKKIKTKVVRNEHNLDRHVGSYLKMITEQRAEIEQLRNREKNAGALAVQRHEKVRQQCYEALEEAKASLETTISKTEESRQQRIMSMARLRSLANQISQVEVWIEAVTKAFADEPEKGVKAIKDAAHELLGKMCSERDSLQQYCDSLQDEAAVDSAIESIKTRLEENSGWTSQDTNQFILHAQLQKQQLENAFLRQAVEEIPVAGSLASMSTMYFDLWSKLIQMKNGDENYMATLEQMLVSMSETCLEVLNSKQFNETTITLPQQPPQPPKSSSSSSFGPAQPPKRLGIKRPFASAQRHTVVIKSPVPTKKPIKRVRWEDDSSESDASMTAAGQTTQPPGSQHEQPHDDEDTRESDSGDETMGNDNNDTTGNSPQITVSTGSNSQKRSKFGVKSELVKRPTKQHHQSLKNHSVLGMNKRAITRIEKENYDASPTSPSRSPNRGNTTKLGVPLRVTVPTAASSMKQVGRNSYNSSDQGKS